MITKNKSPNAKILNRFPFPYLKLLIPFSQSKFLALKKSITWIKATNCSGPEILRSETQTCHDYTIPIAVLSVAIFIALIFAIIVIYIRNRKLAERSLLFFFLFFFICLLFFVFFSFLLTFSSGMKCWFKRAQEGLPAQQKKIQVGWLFFPFL